MTVKVTYRKEERPDQKLWPKGTVPLNCGTCGKLLFVPLFEGGKKLSDALRHEMPDGGKCPGVQPALIKNEIVSVEPMKLPTSLLFDLDYKYSPEKDEEFYRRLGLERKKGE